MTWRQWVALIVVTVALSVLWLGVSIYGGSKVDRFLDSQLTNQPTTRYRVDIHNTIPYNGDSNGG